MISIEDFRLKLEKSKGKKYPRDINISFENNGKTLKAELVGKKTKDDLRGFDPWALACAIEAEKECNIKITSIIFTIKMENSNITAHLTQNIEAFKRRISFLDINNEDIQIELYLGNNKENLYDRKSLFNRPDNEFARNDVNDRSTERKTEKLEKVFQFFLTEKGTNERCAIFGMDFIVDKKSRKKIIREFPTGVLNTTESKNILPTDYIDFVTLNNSEKLALIELKINDNTLGVISQLLDYCLYFACYRKDLIPLVNKKLKCNLNHNDEIYCYVANNYFHERFDEIMPFYKTNKKKYGFTLKKIILGKYTII